MKPLRLTALGGLVLVAIIAPRTATMPALILMLAAGVAVPLGLALVLEPADAAEPKPARSEAMARATPGSWLGWPARALPVVAPFGAAGAVLGWTAAPGTAIAIAGAALHAVTCACAGLLAVTRIWPIVARRKLDPLPELAIDVGLLFLPAAAVWLLASRAGMPLAGFQEPVVTFTAAHFHVAGFAAPVVIGLLGRRLGTAAARPLYRVAALAVCAGVPLTAIGIATNHTIEQASAILVATGMLAASASLIAFARKAPSPLAKVLFVVSGATLLVTMTLAATFALTSSAGRGSSLDGGAVQVQTMIDFHGAANAIGFALAALVALTLTPPPLRPSPPAPASR